MEFWVGFEDLGVCVIVGYGLVFGVVFVGFLVVVGVIVCDFKVISKRRDGILFKVFLFILIRV